LNDATVVDEMTVRWPCSGSVEEFRNIPCNRIIEVTEGKGRWVEKGYRSARVAV